MLAAAVTVAAVVAGLGVGLWLLPDSPPGDPSETPPATSAPPASATPPASTPPQTSNPPGTAPVGPTATGTASPENLRAGDGCSWQQEGDRRTGIDGAVLVCTLADGTYRWRLPG